MSERIVKKRKYRVASEHERGKSTHCSCTCYPNCLPVPYGFELQVRKLAYETVKKLTLLDDDCKDTRQFGEVIK